MCERGLPPGCGCIAIRDTSFPSFPTFPVLHRLHMQIFGELFPPEFINQHGDPFLFELYRRWGASRFTARSSLTNSIGGFGDARYRKATGLHWKGAVLSLAIERLRDWLATVHPGAKQVACIDVVVPTYRCDLVQLERLCSLDCKQPASLQTIVVVDRPTTPNLEELRRLSSYANGRIVRVHVQEANAGASFARNTGLAQSFGDYAVLLDDDVQPRPGLLDAYLGAIARHPGEAAYVGLTELPPPVTWVQCALKACRVCYFYGVASIKRNPPWGVTANICVRSRTIRSDFEYFSRSYPRTGGGEDVDFCIRSQSAGHGKLVAVPEAAVLQPFWDAPFKQVRHSPPLSHRLPTYSSGSCARRLPAGRVATCCAWASCRTPPSVLRQIGRRSRCCASLAAVAASGTAAAAARRQTQAPSCGRLSSK